MADQRPEAKHNYSISPLCSGGVRRTSKTYNIIWSLSVQWLTNEANTHGGILGACSITRCMSMRKGVPCQLEVLATEFFTKKNIKILHVASCKAIPTRQHFIYKHSALKCLLSGQIHTGSPLPLYNSG